MEAAISVSVRLVLRASADSEITLTSSGIPPGPVMIMVVQKGEHPLQRPFGSPKPP